MLFILPTDTCYGLAGELNQADFFDIYRLKGRDFRKQLAILVKDYDDMNQFIEISEDQKNFLKSYPYPWSFLGKKSEKFLLPEFMNEIEYTKISLRVAHNCLGGDILETLDYPLFLTSANLSGYPESTTLEEAIKYFPGISGMDGGICDGRPSDIFSLDPRGEIMYLRQNYKKTLN